VAIHLPQVTIPRVELLEELGRGAHSIVYRAKRDGRFYAVKLPLHGETGAKARFLAERFRREGVALARVRHPALPAVMEVGEADRTPYIVMELAAGQTLAERFRSDPLSEAQIVQTGRQLADVLAAIHRSGLVHRDVKPRNILFDPFTTAVRLVDFGFAASADARLLSEGPVGTLDYMAPEQLAGIRERVDGRADLFSLGCVLFEASTGSPPFKDLDIRRLLHQHERHAPPQIFGRPSLSKGFAEVIARLLARDPDERYVNAEALRDDLDLLDQIGSRRSPARVTLAPIAQLGAGPLLPLVGREHELKRLRATWIEAQAGPGRLISLHGAAGSGKTRLVQALLEDVSRAGRNALVANCPASEASFSAVRQLVEGRLRNIERLTGGERIRAIVRLRQLAGDVAPLLRVLSPELARVFEASSPLPRFDDAEHVFAEALTEFLLKMLRDIEPAFVFVDNVHWLDAGSRRVLARVADRIAGLSVLMVFASRAVEAGSVADRFLQALPRAATAQVELGGLGEGPAIELARAYLGRPRVDADVLSFVSGLTDGSPLGTLEVLRAALEAGVLVPWWGTWRLDRDALSRFQLPRQASEILARRIGDLDPMTRSTLQAAAVLGMTFDDGILPAAAELEEGHVTSALAEARRSLLIEGEPNGTHRFIHDSVRETLVDMLSSEQRRGLHQRIAEHLDERGPSSRLVHAGPFDLPAPEPLPALPNDIAAMEGTLSAQLVSESEPVDHDYYYALATNYAAGEVEKTPQRVFDANLNAGRMAFRAYDNERALTFFGNASRAGSIVQRRFDPEDELLVAEAHLRRGALERSLPEFESVVKRTSDRQIQSLAFSRIAWCQMQLDADAAWVALDSGFARIGAPTPNDSLLSLIVCIVSCAWHAAFPGRVVRGTAQWRRFETLTTLYYLAARLAAQTARPVRLMQATLRCQAPARRIGPSDALTRSFLGLSFVLTALGLRKLGQRYVNKAWEIARMTRDPVVQAHALGVQSTIAAWAGDIREAIRTGARSLEDFGHWRELAEFCVGVHNLAQIEGVRGRNREAWRWLELAIQKVNQYEDPPVALDYLEMAARAALAGLGREGDADIVLGRLRYAVLHAPAKRAIIAHTHGSQARLFTEAARLDHDFETFVAQVRAAGDDPRRVHMDMTEYYVHVAHARVHACLRASGVERDKLLGSLREAAHDLKLAARIPLLVAHSRVIQAYVAWFSRAVGVAERLFAEAQTLGEREGVPWVLYAVHRGRAHLFSEQGNHDEAHDQARLAEAIAAEHGATYRVQWIRQEFRLRSSTRHADRAHSGASSSSWDSTASRNGIGSRGYLRALLRITEARADELTTERQAAAVLDEIIHVLKADRGFLLLASDAARAAGPREIMDRLQVVSARRHGFVEGESSDALDRQLIEKVILLGNTELADGAPEGHRRIGATFDDRRSIIVAPIVVHDAPLGVLYFERALSQGQFREQDMDLLAIFAVQVPVALELARSLYVRERAEESLRSAEKLEAVSKLAGGVAHDFNNMLTVILSSTDAMVAASRSGEVTRDIATIRTAAERARDLTRQLVAFARGQFLSPEVLQPNDSIRRLEPVFRRLLGPTIQLELTLDPDLFTIKVDPAQLDQVLMNLAMNAGDAMPRGGRLVITTENMTIDDDYVRAYPNAKRGRYALVALADSGEGMDEPTLARIFEPFFTTKSDRSGTGLGLATVYGIVTQSGGHIDVQSNIGIGTIFRIYLPRSAEVLNTPPHASLELPEGGTETILVVDDEPLVRDSLRRMLHRFGYRVLLASEGEEALRVAGNHLDEIQLMITDVLMPGMNGLELAREVSKLSSRIKVLFISGYTDGVLAERGILRERVEFMQKPLSQEVLARRVREVLDRAGG
jgi:eukaryotic-like serine/threonine-protein kinase